MQDLLVKMITLLNVNVNDYFNKEIKMLRLLAANPDMDNLVNAYTNYE